MRHEIRYHLTGGLTGAAYGEPRLTQDIDVVIDPKGARQSLAALLDSFSQTDFMYDAPSIRLAVQRGDMFQLLDRIESLKLDLYPREMIPGELDRSESLEIFEGEFLPVVSRVDAAVSKLIWIGKGSHKSRGDLRAIVRNATVVQNQQIQELAACFDLGDLLTEVLIEPDEFK